jgi:cell fate (sporulation/competence/biofilm development) regulator YmcA (YheA/YmcA/DUF963 family)
MEEKVEHALEQLIQLIQEDPAITEYKSAEQMVKDQAELMNLAQEIKTYNQKIVNFGHYGLQRAREHAQEMSEQKTKVFEDDLLVQNYRAGLFEANELLQHITQRITKQINREIE